MFKARHLTISRDKLWLLQVQVEDKADEISGGIQAPTHTHYQTNLMGGAPIKTLQGIPQVKIRISEL